MTPEDLDLVVARTRHGRFRDLTDPAHPAYDPAYLRTVEGLAAKFRAAARPAPPSLDADTFVTLAMLARDSALLAAKVPPDAGAVVGAARSGLPPAATIATLLHLPLASVSAARGVVSCGGGGRLEGRPWAGPVRRVLLVDDTAATGRELARCLPLVRAAYPGAEITTAVVYCHPRALGRVDLCHALYPGEHYLEWNWQNAGHGHRCAFDHDGIICPDSDPSRPLYLPRRAPVPMVVTGRHESARGMTEDFYRRWGVRVERLVMRDFPDDSAEAIARFKARVYRESDCVLFAESDPAQAEIIAAEGGKPVLCPAAGRVIRPKAPAAAVVVARDPSPAPRRLPPTPSNPYALGAACPWRDVESCGCRVPRCWAGLGDRDGGRGCSLVGASACVTRYLLKPGKAPL